MKTFSWPDYQMWSLTKINPTQFLMQRNDIARRERSGRLFDARVTFNEGWFSVKLAGHEHELMAAAKEGRGISRAQSLTTCFLILAFDRRHRRARSQHLSCGDAVQGSRVYFKAFSVWHATIYKWITGMWVGGGKFHHRDLRTRNHVINWKYFYLRRSRKVYDCRFFLSLCPLLRLLTSWVSGKLTS